jgi:predicted AlkP superfamily pyrophosphatase or phosphodiesterase
MVASTRSSPSSGGMRRTLVLNVVGLTPSLLGEHTPNLLRLTQRGGMRPLRTVLPAVTCTAQTTFITGLLPARHGAVANGWYFRDLSEVWLWRQSNRLIDGERIWDAARRRDASFTCANLCWWYNMYSGADITVTPRPMYPADGRKIPDCYTHPSELRDELTSKLGRFPLFKFWGPMTDIGSTRWIAAATHHVRRSRRPTLTLVYLPHLDYNLQRLGPDDPRLADDLREVDAVCGELIEEAEGGGDAVIVLSEYGVTLVDAPIHINRALRQAGFIRVRLELGREVLDPGASPAFAVADHQVAHVYVQQATLVPKIKALLEGLPGVERVLDAEGKRAAGLDHPRAGELVAVAEPNAWFTYYWWLDDSRAPDYARTVDIHRKPGFDPVELFLDPALRWPKLAVAWRLAKRAAGRRTLLDVIPLDATLVKGSHGRPTDSEEAGPLFMSSEAGLLPSGAVAATDVKELILAHVFVRQSRDRRRTAATAG